MPRSATTDSSQNSDTNRLTPSYAFEHVTAKLIPFDLMMIGAAGVTRPTPAPLGALGGTTISRVANTLNVSPQSSKVRSKNQEDRDGHPLFPIFKTNGLIFPFNPIISEGVSVSYDAIDLTHSNESYHIYKATQNVRINLSNAVWTCDTFENALYALSALHFFRVYSFMDFGRGRTGRPPSPMWFEAYGNYAFHRVPVLMEKADWSFPNDVDYVGIPEPNTNEWKRGTLATRRTGSGGKYTWLPIKFEVASISLIVQHSPSYWKNFNLDDYRNGTMLSSRGSFHAGVAKTPEVNRITGTIGSI